MPNIWNQLAFFAIAVWFSCFSNAYCDGVYPSVLAEQLDQYCNWKSMSKTNQSHAVNPTIVYRGKPGPRGPPGREGEVNYTIVQGMINEELSERNCEDKISALTEKVELLEKELRQMTRNDCSGLLKADAKVWNDTGGVFDIYIIQYGRKMEVFCDLETDRGNWIVFQRRMDGSENFQRDYADYVKGFGRPDGEFWLGLANIHILTTASKMQMRIDLTDWENNTIYAQYMQFSVGDASSQYTIDVTGYYGTAGDSMAYHNGQPFYTRDRDTSSACSGNHKGGWWYKDCYHANLNGLYINGGSYRYSRFAYGIDWFKWKNTYGYSFKIVEMKLRPI